MPGKGPHAAVRDGQRPGPATQRYLSDEPVEACPPRQFTDCGSSRRNNRAVLTTAATIAGALGCRHRRRAHGRRCGRRGRRPPCGRPNRTKRKLPKASGSPSSMPRTSAARPSIAAAEKAAEDEYVEAAGPDREGCGSLFAGMLRGSTRGPKSKGASRSTRQSASGRRRRPTLDAESVGDPQAVARLQTILGSTLRDLGSYAKAVEVLEKARAIRERELGRDHPATLVTLTRLASAYLAAGKVRGHCPGRAGPRRRGQARVRPPHHPRDAQQPGQCLPGRREAARGHRPLRTGPGCPGQKAGSRPP